MRHLILPAAYLLMFLVPLTARSWRTLGWTACLGVAAILGIVLLASLGGGFMLFVFTPLILLCACGWLAGCATKAVLLLTTTPVRSFRFGLIVLAGAGALPTAVGAYVLSGQMASRAAYAALPSAQSLPDIPACLPLRAQDGLVGSVLVRDDAKGPDALPGPDVSLRYPVAYRAPAVSRFPAPVQRTNWIGFRMHIADASPVRRDDEVDADGAWIPPRERRPEMSFRLVSRAPVARQASRMLQIAFGETSLSDETPNLRLGDADGSTLRPVLNEAARGARDRDRFVSIGEGLITRLVECRREGQVPNPTCAFHFDHRGVAVDGQLPRSQLSNWAQAERHVTAFLDCAMAASAAGIPASAP